MPVITIGDFDYRKSGEDVGWPLERSRWCCERLENGDVLRLDSVPFDLGESDQQFLLSQEQSGSSVHKNISYRPQEDKLRGFAKESGQDLDRLQRIMRDYSNQVTSFMARLVAPYAPHWKLDFASFRPLEEQGRDLPLHKRNDLLHVDAFPSRPTCGGRILRCFTNLNPSQPRKWLIGDRFSELARRYAADAGLARIAQGPASPESGLRQGINFLKRAIGMRAQERSAYDKFMLRLHDYLKENAAFQRDGGKTEADFPPHSTWIVFTDAVPHAVLSGRFALEQTFIVPLSALLAPEVSPLRTLEGIAGRRLVA